MNCEQALHRVSAKIDRQLPPGEAPALQEHLGSCPACREALADLEAQHRLLGAQFAAGRRGAERVAAGVLERLRAAGEPAPAASPRRGRLHASIIAFFAAAAGFLAAFLLVQLRQPAPGGGGAAAPGMESAAAPAEAPCKVALAKGAVEMFPPGAAAWREARAGEPLPEGSRLRTGKSALCEVATSDGSVLRLNQETELRLGDLRTLELARGQIWTAARGEKPFIVEAPAAASAVNVAGTECDLRLEGNRATLRVYRGAAIIQARDGKHSIPEGEKATLASGRVSERGTEYEILRQINWMHELLILKGDRNEQLASRIKDLFAQLGQTKVDLLIEQDIRGLGDHCVIPLISYIQSERSEGSEDKRIRAALIISDLAQAEHIAPLIQLLGDKNGEVRYYAARALKRLTGNGRSASAESWRTLQGAELEDAIQKWQAWWQSNQSRFPATIR